MAQANEATVYLSYINIDIVFFVLFIYYAMVYEVQK